MVEISLVRTEDSVLLQIRGTITGKDVPAAVRELGSVDTKGLSRVVVDFFEVTYLQPEIMNALFGLLHRLAPEGKLELIARTDGLRRLFGIAGVAGRSRVQVRSQPADVLAA